MSSKKRWREREGFILSSSQARRHGTEAMKPFQYAKGQLLLFNNCIRYRAKVLIHKCYRRNVLEQLHVNPLYILTMKDIDRSLVLNPKIDKETNEFIKASSSCFQNNLQLVNVRDKK